MIRIALLSTFMLTSACTSFPELDARVSERAETADFPALIPLDGIADGRAASRDRADDITSSLQARITALNARAARLRGDVLTPAERRRLTQGAGA